MLSVGGWTGSRFFSSSVATPENRTAFATALIDFADNNSLDGLDFECVFCKAPDSSHIDCFSCSWEYPNSAGIGCNVINGNDTDNFLALLKQVRQKARKDFQLTAAVAIKPFIGPDGNPLTDVSGFAQVLDRIGVSHPSHSVIWC